MRTTLDINDAILTELRQRAGTTGKSFRETVNEVLQIGLAGSALPKAGPVRLKTFQVGVKAAYRATSMNQLFDQLEVENHLKVGAL